MKMGLKDAAHKLMSASKEPLPIFPFLMLLYVGGVLDAKEVEGTLGPEWANAAKKMCIDMVREEILG